MNIGRAVLVAGFLLLLALFLSLGEWQLRRAAEKTLIFDRFGTGQDLPALTTPVDSERLEEYRYRILALRGRYDSSRQFLLDSMIYQGRAGYHVLTAFRPLGAERWLLVNRGWVRADPDRRVLPQLAVSEVVREVRGRIDTLPRPGLRLETAGPDEADNWPQVMLFPTIDELGTRLGEPLFGYQLWLDSESPDGFVRDWAPRTMAPERHVGYAIQWFGLAGVLVVMAVVLGVDAAKRRDDRADD